MTGRGFTTPRFLRSPKGWLGFLIFADLPDALTILGIAIIIGSGLFVILRERRAP